jgi:hypothetical protein
MIGAPNLGRNLMGYQLVVWEGVRPADDDAGVEQFRALAEQHLLGEPTEPTPAIRAFIEALTTVWTDDPDDPRWDKSPWKYPPLLDGASGPMVFLDLRLRSEVIISTVIASIAEDHGLVTLDLMVGMLRPVSENVIAEHARRTSGSLN